MLLTKDRPIHEGNQPLTDDILTRVERRYLREVAEAEQKAKEKPKPDDPPTRRTEPTDRGLYADVEVVAAGRDEGTPELSKRLPTYRTIAITGMDGEGKREQQVVRRTSDLMKRMSDSGLLTPNEAAAGRKFRSDFETGKLGGLHAPDLRRVPGCGEADLSERAMDARQAVGGALDYLRAHGGAMHEQAAWQVLGLGLSVKEWAASRIFGSGRPVSEKTGSGIVMSVCGMLARHYGI